MKNAGRLRIGSRFAILRSGEQTCAECWLKIKTMGCCYLCDLRMHSMLVSEVIRQARWSQEESWWADELCVGEYFLIFSLSSNNLDNNHLATFLDTYLFSPSFLPFAREDYRRVSTHLFMASWLLVSHFCLFSILFWTGNPLVWWYSSQRQNVRPEIT